MFLLCYAAVCLVWGSTYLASRFAVQTIPPLLMSGVRFMIAGGCMFVVLRLRSVPLPTRPQWLATSIIGALLITCGNGGFTIAVRYVPSGVAALLATSLPLWTVLMDWLRPQGSRPSGGMSAGLLLGFVGIVFLVQPWNSRAADVHGEPLYMMLICGAIAAWAVGSLYARQANVPASPLMTTAAQMLAGGALMTLIGTGLGEWSQVHWSEISAKSLVSMLYLIIFGSIVAFSAYAWLVKHVSPALASSYTYVNPLIALVLGWLLGGETITGTMLGAGAIILLAVVMIAKYKA
jgi:drug/metabolite transporter (DMT)-like permease